jgi:hypothetical protein
MELDFIGGNPISQGIPWNNFSEVEIHALLKVHFESLGFGIIWRHKDDPANENGVDLECTSIKDNSKILIAVKKKPKKEDIGQLLELSQTQADKKIYVYINGASQSFREKMPFFASEIEFWDEKQIEDNLMKSYLTFRLLIDNSYTNYSIQVIKDVLRQTITSSKRRPFPKPNKDIMNILWAMKDRAVTLNKCSGMLQLMFEDSKRFGNLTPSQIQNLVLWCFDELYSASLFALHDSMRSLPNELVTIFQYTYDRTKARSNWLNLFSYPPRFIPGNLDTLINKDTSIAELKELQKLLEESDIQNILLDEAANEFRLLCIWAEGLEGTIDYVYLECLDELEL